MHKPPLVVALIATAVTPVALFALVLCIVAGYNSRLTLAQLYDRCAQTAVEQNRLRIKSCQAILVRPDLMPQDKGTIYSQLCAAEAHAGNWPNTIEACTTANALHPRFNNLLNRAFAYDRLGQKEKADADRLEAEMLRPKATQ